MINVRRLSQLRRHGTLRDGLDLDVSGCGLANGVDEIERSRSERRSSRGRHCYRDRGGGDRCRGGSCSGRGDVGGGLDSRSLGVDRLDSQQRRADGIGDGGRLSGGCCARDGVGSVKDSRSGR